MEEKEIQKKEAKKVIGFGVIFFLLGMGLMFVLFHNYNENSVGRCYDKFDEKDLKGIDRNIFNSYNCYQRGDYIDVYATTYNKTIYWFRCYDNYYQCINFKIYKEWKGGSQFLPSLKAWVSLRHLYEI